MIPNYIWDNVLYSFVLKQKSQTRLPARQEFKAGFYFSVHLSDNFYATIAQAVTLVGYCSSPTKIIRMQDEK